MCLVCEIFYYPYVCQHNTSLPIFFVVIFYQANMRSVLVVKNRNPYQLFIVYFFIQPPDLWRHLHLAFHSITNCRGHTMNSS